MVILSLGKGQDSPTILRKGTACFNATDSFGFSVFFYQIHIIQIPITNLSDIQFIETGKHLFHFRDPLKIFCNTFYRKLSVRHGLYNVEIREIEKISIQLNAKFNFIIEFTTEEDC